MKQNIIKITEQSGIPLIGAIQFGIIDRGTNLLQIRPTTVCPLKCIFCSTSANSTLHPYNFEIDLPYLVKSLKEIAVFKGNSLEANIDSMGEPLAYPKVIELIQEIKKIKQFSKISMQTNGILLTKDLVKKLEDAGLDHINVSIQSLDEEKSKYLSGFSSYDIKKIKESLELISKSRIELMITPVYIPKINDDDIEEIIKYAKQLNAKLGIQKYEVYKFGRKPKQAKKQSWYQFYNYLEELGKKYDIKLKLSRKDFNIEQRETYPLKFRNNEIISIVIKCPGWVREEMIGVAKEVCITVDKCNAKIGDKIKVKILSNKHNIYFARQIK
ncbi:MAG: radical SAM protein [Candidatus Nanoarchaeia archaeon]|nr:radical SAM protein [Candidatus Nanoarchaeia archaeon]